MPALALRPFTEADFPALMGWVRTPDALAQWCAAFFSFPLDTDQLRRYLDSAAQTQAREIFAAEWDGEAVGHVELSMIWPHLSCRLSRVLVAPKRRQLGFGRTLVDLACEPCFLGAPRLAN
jgi:RimJ/RimL family protein N-acetyltransferase